MDQLLNTKADLESYFSSDVLTENPWMSSKWVFVPMLYCEEIEQEVKISQTCEGFVIQGKYLYSLYYFKNQSGILDLSIVHIMASGNFISEYCSICNTMSDSKIKIVCTYWPQQFHISPTSIKLPGLYNNLKYLHTISTNLFFQAQTALKLNWTRFFNM